MSEAKPLNDAELRAVLRACLATRYAERNRVVVLLAFKAGLRAGEITRLRRWHVMTAGGDLADTIALDKMASPRPRTVPISVELRSAIIAHWKVCPGSHDDPLVLSERAEVVPTKSGLLAPMLPRSIVRLFGQLFLKVGIVGARSHSGRRTFGTRAAKAIKKAGGTLKDVQQLLGHADMASTQSYIEGDDDAQRKVVNLI